MHVNPQKGINKMHWRKAQVKFCASTIVETRHVVLKPSPGLGCFKGGGFGLTHGITSGLECTKPRESPLCLKQVKTFGVGLSENVYLCLWGKAFHFWKALPLLPSPRHYIFF